MSILTLLAVYTTLVLLFVPLDKIAKWQTKVRATWKKIKKNIED